MISFGEREKRDRYPSKILITGGHEIGGVASFAEGLRTGFSEIGIPVEVIPTSQIFMRWRDLRDPNILKILSTTAVFTAPFARRAICMAHGVTRAHGQGIAKMAGVLTTFKLANAAGGVQMVAVSEYVATHLETIFDVRIDSVIHNPLRTPFLDVPQSAGPRNYITFIGRLEPVKNVHRLLPAIRDVLDGCPGLRACIAGNGSQRALLQNMARNDMRIEFPGELNSLQVREMLRHSRVFVSGTPTEGLGIAYVEALSHGCSIAMPGCGGGLELALERIGASVQLFSCSLDRKSVISALRRALSHPSPQFPIESFAPSAIAAQFLKIDARFSNDGRSHAGRGSEDERRARS